MLKPEVIFGRNFEWDKLTGIAEGAADSGLAVGIIHGRRQSGKSFLLYHLCQAQGGFYHQAIQHGREQALRRFNQAVAAHAGLSAVPYFDGWESALNHALDIFARQGASPLLVIDEFPYLVKHSPELPSVLQAIHDVRHPTFGGTPATLLLCGSAISVMTGLLGGDQPLYNRIRLNLAIRPFDYRLAAEFWRAPTPEVAFRVHAVVGGSPGYQVHTRAAPRSMAAFGHWLLAGVLDPTNRLFDAMDAALSEDPRISDRFVYHAILQAVAEGATTPARIAASLGRDTGSLAHSLDVLRSGGFLHWAQDVLKQRNPVITVADPVVRFHRLITDAGLEEIQSGPEGAREVWERSASTFSSRILGPHFEQLAREYVRSFARYETLDGMAIGEVGTTEFNCRQCRAQHEVDVVALTGGSRARSAHMVIAALGEAKATNKRRGVDDLRRLEHIRTMLPTANSAVDSSGAKLLLFSRVGFSEELTAIAATRTDARLVDLEAMYGGSILN